MKLESHLRFWLLPRSEHKRIHEMLLTKHYAQRLPQMKFAFVVSNDDEILGCCTFGIPASYTLCNGVCGKSWRKNVLELTRLCICYPGENLASQLIGFSLRNLPDQPWIVVSYADPNVGHVGYVYQASNWIYTGLSSAEPAWHRSDTGDLVSTTRRHIDRKAAKIFGEGANYLQVLEKRPRSGKHRYLFISGSKKDKKSITKEIRYKAIPYAKGQTKTFDFSSP